MGPWSRFISSCQCIYLQSYQLPRRLAPLNFYKLRLRAAAIDTVGRPATCICRIRACDHLVLSHVLASFFPVLNAASLNFIVAPLSAIFSPFLVKYRSRRNWFCFRTIHRRSNCLRSKHISRGRASCLLYNRLDTWNRQTRSQQCRPANHVSNSLRTLRRSVYVDYITVCLVVYPLIFIDVSVCVPEPARLVSFIVAPLVFILRKIGPNLDSGLVSHAVLETIQLRLPVSCCQLNQLISVGIMISCIYKSLKFSKSFR